MSALRWAALALILLPPVALRAEPNIRDEARQALKKAATYYREKVASHGGYVYYYTPDLKDRWGEGRADPDTVFVQPPGTPTVGLAYLKAFAATGDAYYRGAARDAAGALIDGQLQSGGWTQTIHYGPAKRLGKYRTRRGGNWNTSSLDDGQTQAALTMLVRTDKALGFNDEKVHQAATYGLDALLKAQFPNGAFPQVWSKPVERHPVVKARYPDHDWRTEGRVKNYWDYYTLNDGLAGTVAEVLIEAHQTYQDDKFKAALARFGDFLILAQMPDPQPGWCQQYGYDMVPIWARKFEPAAVTGWESQDAMETLIRIARYTNDTKYLDPIPRALAYFRKSLLPDGRVARYYELKTNKPLYMNEWYELTYDDAAAPSHYGWKQPARFDRIAKEYEAARAGVERRPPGPPKDLEERVRTSVRELDAEGRWLSTYAGEGLVGQPKFASGLKYISSAVFSRNVETLSEYLATK
jgi:PelA/Pel-15E family pectate lyase